MESDMLRQPRTEEKATTFLQIIANCEKKLERLKQKRIILFGRRRVGLSNMFNWIIGEKMIGEINYAHVNYVLNDLGAVTRAARIGPGIRRITQELNVGNLDKETSVIDLQGYGEDNAIETLTQSHLMARIIDGDVHVKFLLVVDQNELMSNDGRAVCELFYKFFSWFKIDYCSEDIRKTLYSAVGLVITRAREDVDNFTHLEELNLWLREGTAKDANERACKECLAVLLQETRIEYFMQAQEREEPKVCQLINQLNRIGWRWLEMTSINMEFLSGVIQLERIPEYNEKYNLEEVDYLLCCFIHNAKRDEEKEILEECFKIETVFLKELSKGLWNFYKRIEVVINSEIEVMDYSEEWEELARLLSSRRNQNEILMSVVETELIAPDMTTFNIFYHLKCWTDYIKEVHGNEDLEFKQYMDCCEEIYTELIIHISAVCCYTREQALLLERGKLTIKKILMNCGYLKKVGFNVASEIFTFYDNFAYMWLNRSYKRVLEISRVEGETMCSNIQVGKEEVERGEYLRALERYLRAIEEFGKIYQENGICCLSRDFKRIYGGIDKCLRGINKEKNADNVVKMCDEWLERQKEDKYEWLQEEEEERRSKEEVEEGRKTRIETWRNFIQELLNEENVAIMK